MPAVGGEGAKEGTALVGVVVAAAAAVDATAPPEQQPQQADQTEAVGEG